MADNKLKIPYGKKDGELIHISQAKRGLKCGCLCPGCGSPLIARKGDIQAHHYSHKPNTFHCNSETYIHLTAKDILKKRIETALQDEQYLEFNWWCNPCFKEYTGNLLKKAATVEVEKSLGICRPDLVLLDAEGNPTNLIEIVVKHKPEEHVVQFVKENKLGLIEFHLKEMSELELLKDSEVLEATKVFPCKNPDCKPRVRMKEPENVTVKDQSVIQKKEDDGTPVKQANTKKNENNQNDSPQESSWIGLLFLIIFIIVGVLTSRRK
jgi:hypothetical protein